MMKRKFLAVVLPIVGCATVVGSGFSAWYFGAATSASDTGFTVNTNVTEEISSAKDTLSISDSNAANLNEKHLILDQGGMDDLSKADVTKGIMVADSVVNETTERELNYTFKVTYDGNSAGLSLNDVYYAQMKLVVTVSITFSSGEGEKKSLDDFVKVKDSAVLKVGYTTPNQTKDVKFTTADGGVTYQAQFVLEQSELASLVTEGEVMSYTWSFTLDLSTNESLVNALFEYEDKPADHDELEAMRTAVSGTTVSFATIAEIKDQKA